MENIKWYVGKSWQSRVHHTAVVDAITSDSLHIFEQNVPVGGHVIRTNFPYHSIAQGRYWVYRPIRK